jgi:hypothetical protein
MSVVELSNHSTKSWSFGLVSLLTFCGTTESKAPLRAKPEKEKRDIPRIRLG